jgi:sugar-specific transcriptional regulator TrmB
LIKEVKEFLRNSNLSNYEINTYITLLNSNNLTAREISNKSNVPTGRIYEILEGLKDKGMIEIQESRPKIFRAISFNQASHDLIAHIRSRQQRKTSFLLNQAKQLETKINNSYLSIRQESSKIFWSTAYGWQPIVKLYKKKFNTLQENLLMTGFLNENTLKVLPYAKDFYEGILNAHS